MAIIKNYQVVNYLKGSFNIKLKDYKCFMIAGDDDYLKAEVIRSIENKILGEASREFNLKSFDFKNGDSLDDVLNAADVMPFMSEKTVVLARDFPYEELYEKKGEVGGISKLKMLPESSAVIFYNASLSADFKKGSKSEAVKNEMDKLGVFFDCSRLGERELREIIKSGAEHRGLLIDSTIIEHLLYTSGTELMSLQSELDKLQAVKNSSKNNLSEISKKDIDSICRKCTEANAFDYAGAVLNKKTEKAFDIIRFAVENGEDMQKLLGSVIYQFAELYRIMLYKSYGASDVEIAKDFYNGNTYRLKRPMQLVFKETLKGIKKKINVLEKTDMALKTQLSNKDSQRLLFELMTVKLLNTND